MSLPRSLCVLRLAAISLLVAITLTAAPAQPDRVKSPIEETRTTLLRGNLPHEAQNALDEGSLEPATKIAGMRLMLKQSPAQSAALAQLLEEQRDPKSVNYHKWLTPEEFGERFGVSTGDLAKLTNWLNSQGFTGTQVARARNWIVFDGPVASVEKAFHTALHHYRAGGTPHYANASEPSIPAALASVVGSLRGLDDFHPKPPHLTKTIPQFTFTDGSHYIAPGDMAAIYDISRLYDAGIDGTGQKIAIVGQTDITLANVTYFRNYFGLPVNNPQMVLTGADPGYSAGDAGESYLDLEWAGAVARNATILFVYSTDVFTSVLYEIDQNLAPVMSMSYGGCELWTGTGVQAWAQQANAEGITWMASSGDSGAASCDWDGNAIATNGLAVLSPADVPEITAVGGTEFNEGSSGWNAQNGANSVSVTGYLPEMGWNDAVAFKNGIVAGGGGVSVKFAKPWWQSGPGVPNDGARDLPDVALTASADHDGYLVWTGGLQAYGGTSASSPVFAGIVALINQYLVTQSPQTTPGLGNINPILYSLAQNSTGVFHDITSGSNVVPCQLGSTGCTTGTYGYQAGPGYDLVTGLGSVDAYNLVTNWSSVSSLVGTATTLAASPSTLPQTATVQLTATVTALTGSTVPVGQVTFGLGGNPLSAPVATALNGTAASALVNIPASSLTVGANLITATFVPSGTFSSSFASQTVTVTSTQVGTSTSLRADPSTFTTAGSTQLTATVSASSGGTAPTGMVTFLNGSTTLGTSLLAGAGTSATATLTVSGSSLGKGSSNITASYRGAGNFLSSNSASVAITVTAALPSTTTTVSASPTAIAANATTLLTVSVRPASGTVAPSGSVTVMSGSTSLGSIALKASGASASGTLIVKGASLVGGPNTITATYPGMATFAASSGSATVTLPSNAIATTTSVAANPTSLAKGAATQLSATVRQVSGAAVPAGTVNFTTAGVSLGSATLSTAGGTATAMLPVAGASLAYGANNITATYLGSTQFNSSAGSVTVSLTGGAVATTLSISASPASIAAGATTQLSVRVTAATGTAAPSGTVAFSLGQTSLGTAALAQSGSTGIATLNLNSSSLATGANTISVSYAGTSAFSGSSGSVNVTLAAPAKIQTSVGATATPVSVSTTGTTQLAVTVTPASGSTPPTGNITFTLGRTALGTASLTPSGSKATAAFTLHGSSLGAGSNTISVTYAGSDTFSGATGSVAVTLVTGSKEVLTATKASSVQKGFTVKLQVQETAGVATTVTGFTINGTNFSSVISSFFGAAQLPPSGTLSGTMTIQWSPLPNPLVFVLSGVDAGGQTWSQTTSLNTK